MEKICLSTELVIGYLQNKEDAVAYVKQLEANNDIAVTPSTLFSLFCIAAASEKPEENKHVIHELLKRVTVLEETAQTAEKAAELFTEITKKNKKIEIEDIFLAATAQTYGYIIATLSPEKYAALEGVKIYKL